MALCEVFDVVIRGNTVENQDFVIHAGNTKKYIFVVEDADDLIGVSAVFKVSKRPDSEELILRKSTADASIDISQNRVIVKFYREDTKDLLVNLSNDDLNRGIYYHELILKDQFKNVSTVAVGKMIVKPSLFKEDLDD